MALRTTLVNMRRNVAKIDRNREYDPFAAIYNRHWGADYRKEVAPVVERLLLSRIPAGANVLDVCCGTGQFTGQVRRLGYRVAGLDASSEMIRYARENAPGVDFTVADVRDFRLVHPSRAVFDAAYCVYESLNHVRDIAGLSMAFASIRKHLERGAPFLFDLNREEAYVLYWNNQDSIVEQDSVCVMRSEFDEESKTGKYDVVAFERTGDGSKNQWRRTDFTLGQTCHDFGAVHSTLFESGFTEVTMYDARDIGMKGDAGYGRTFFLCSA
jgi:SAM-dependent methyltransferase